MIILKIPRVVVLVRMKLLSPSNIPPVQFPRRLREPICSLFELFGAVRLEVDNKEGLTGHFVNDNDET